MKKGIGLMITGLLFIAAALFILIYNTVEDQHAEEASATVLEQMYISQEIIPQEHVSVDEPEQAADIIYPDYVLNPDKPLSVQNINEVDYVGIVSIPSIELELPVCNQWDYDNLQIAPCRYAGTPYKSGFVICAHNYDNHFGSIKNLNYGDEVTFSDIDGNLFRYTVGSVETLQPEAVEQMTESGWDLTLFTCTIGGATRVTVRCEKAE